MGKFTLLERLRYWIAGIGFRVFIWGNQTTENDYLNQVYEVEKIHREKQSGKK